MSTAFLIAFVLLIVVLVGIFSYRVNAAYHTIGAFVAAIAALLLFLVAIHAIHF